MKIDIHSNSIDKALAALKQKLPTLLEEPDYTMFGYLGNTTPELLLEHAFEHEYGCKIMSDDEFGLQGHIIFPEEKYAMAFVLRFGGNDPQRNYEEL